MASAPAKSSIMPMADSTNDSNANKVVENHRPKCTCFLFMPKKNEDDVEVLTEFKTKVKSKSRILYYGPNFTRKWKKQMN